MRKWIYRIAIVIGLIAFALAVWFAGPLIGFGESRPFASLWVRILIISVVFLIIATVYGVKYWRKRKAQKALEAALTDEKAAEGDAKVLTERMSEALDTLKRSSGKSNYLYELPWYIIVGPPGAGKTTALVNSGMKFPLAGADGGKSIAGVGGTRYCDWWFTEEAVLIDTAGRYTTQDSDSEADKKSWQSFLNLLKSNRERQPINGVIVAISLEDLMKLDGQELNDHAVAIRKRLMEIHQELKIDFPVYALFTKADLIAGFMEYFGNFTESRRRKVWGATFQTDDPKKNMVSEVPAEFDALVKRLTEEMTDRLHEEADPISRIAIFDFPSQFSTMRDRVSDFLNRIFEPTRYQVNANLRGFYFSSGTQEGTPIDQVLGAMGRSMDAAARASHMSGSGRSFFLHDLLTKVIFAEAGWVSYNRAAVRRSAIVRYSALTLIALVATGALGAWGVSFANNKALINATENSASEYRVNADPFIKSDTVSDINLENVVGVLHTLRSMPVGYDHRNEATPTEETFGLSQRERLRSAADTTYRQALERMFRSRLILRLERQIEANLNDPIVLYEALKVYLMLGGKAPKVDKELIVAWMRQDWEDNLYPGPNNRAGRQELEAHLRAMLDLNVAYRPTFELNGPLVDNAQRSLARMNMADRAFALIKSAAYAAPIEDFYFANRGGPDAPLVFETVDGSDLSELKVNGLYTYSGFQGFFLNQLAAVAEKLLDEQWVMGEVGQQDAVEQQFGRLGPELLDRYGKEFVSAWNDALANLKLKPMAADKPQYITLSAASSPTSPIRQLFEAIAKETELTREPEDDGSGLGGLVAGAGDSGNGTTTEAGSAASQAAGYVGQRIADRTTGLARIGIQLAVRKSQARAGQLFSGGGNGGFGGGGGRVPIPGANIEAQFRPFHMFVEGDEGKRPVDVLIQNYYEVYQSLVLAATSPSQSERATANLQIQIANLRTSASRLPRPLARMVNDAVEDFEGDAANTSISQLNQMLNSTVTRSCEQVTANRYPFARRSNRDVPMADFARLFAPNGIIDRFFAQNLAPMADMSGDVWVWKQDTRLGREMSNTALREFQRASIIRDAFFPQGGSMPAVSLQITPFSIHGQVDFALFDINGQLVQAQQAGNVPVSLQWPGSLGSGTASVQLLPELPGRKSEVRVTGPWALMRLIDSGSVTRSGDNIRVRFVIGGRDVSYDIRVGSLNNPFFLRELADFSCPAGL